MLHILSRREGGVPVRILLDRQGVLQRLHPDFVSNKLHRHGKVERRIILMRGNVTMEIAELELFIQ